MTNFRLSSAQCGHTLFLLGVAAAESNAQGRGEYTRLSEVLAGTSGVSGHYEVNLNAQQIETIRNGLEQARSTLTTTGASPPGWFGAIQDVWGSHAVGAGR